jgi:DNA-binding response OmpR family regulator
MRTNTKSVMKPCAAGAVLLADDDRDYREVFRLATQDARWLNQVVEFEDGEQLIEYLNKRAGGTPALIILDVKMGDLGGIGVLYWLRKRSDLDRVPAMMLSSSSRERDIRESLALGAADYRVKPIDYGDLVQLARDVHQRWLQPPRAKGQIASRFEQIRRQIRRQDDRISLIARTQNGVRHFRPLIHA